jgi:MFS family permease
MIRLVRSFTGATFASLTVRNYRLFFVGQAVSSVGNWMQKMAQAWLMLELTDSGFWLGLVLAAQQLPTLLFATWGGLLADRHDKRTILLRTAAAGAVPAVLLGALSFGDHLSTWGVLAIAFGLGMVDAVEKPTRQSFSSELVGPEHLANAVTLSNVVQNTGKAVGPAVAGVLIALVGLPWTFLVNAASFAALIWATLAMDPVDLHVHRRVERARGQVREGLRYVWHTPRLLGPVLLLAITGLLAYNFQLMLPLLAREGFDGDARLAGIMLSAQGVGSVVGGLGLAGVLAPTLRRVVLASLVLGGTLGAIALTTDPVTAVVVVLLMGVSSVAFRTLAGTWLQLTARPDMRGRVMSLLVVAIGGTTPIGAPAVGWVAGALGTRAAFGLVGAGTMLAAVAVAAYLRRALQPTPDTEVRARVG